MKTLEQLKAEQAAETAELIRKHEIAAALPFPPQMIVMHGTRPAWVCYTVQTLREALAIFSGFPVLPCSVWRAGCTMVSPESVMTPRELKTYGEHFESGPWACEIRTDQGEGFGPNAELVFYAQVCTGPVRVGVKFGADYIGACNALRAESKTERDRRTDRIISRTFTPNAEAAGAADKVISWASGDMGQIKKSASYSYLFCADTADIAPGSEMSHALAMLEILADRAKV